MNVTFHELYVQSDGDRGQVGIAFSAARPAKEDPCTVRATQKLLERYRCQVGLRIHCHQRRHTVASARLTAEADLVVIQHLLGHRQVQTTQKYGRVAKEKVRVDYFQPMEKIVS